MHCNLVYNRTGFVHSKTTYTICQAVFYSDVVLFNKFDKSKWTHKYPDGTVAAYLNFDCQKSYKKEFQLFVQQYFTSINDTNKYNYQFTLSHRKVLNVEIDLHAPKLFLVYSLASKR